MQYAFNKINRVYGEIELQGDKSISHRALILSALADGVSEITNAGEGEDISSTINCLRQLGCKIEEHKNVMTVHGVGFKGFKKPDAPLDAGNSGTAARLMAGILIHQDFDSIITGDESLSKRPMGRIIKPLSKMGGIISGTPENTLPLNISQSLVMNPLNWSMTIPSAQVKSSVILSGIHLDDESTFTERISTRDHTERMLCLSHIQENGITFSRKNYPNKDTYQIPGDISTASFYIVAALLAEDSVLTIKNVSLNRTRTGFLKILSDMGAKIDVVETGKNNNELYGDLDVYSSQLKNVPIPPDLISNIIDEIPALAVAGAFAKGEFSIRGVKELRYKESDRITSLCLNFRRAGFHVGEREDGFIIGGNLTEKSVEFESYNDHRIAMAFAIFSLFLAKGGKVNNFECIDISNPNFLNQLNMITE